MGGLHKPQILNRQQQYRRALQVVDIGNTLAMEAYAQTKMFLEFSF